jgi:hypothetical protein
MRINVTDFLTNLQSIDQFSTTKKNQFKAKEGLCLPT